MLSSITEEAVVAGAESAGFAVISPVVEIGGLCQSCAGADHDTRPE